MASYKPAHASLGSNDFKTKAAGFFGDLDRNVVFFTLALVTYGLIVIYSASLTIAEADVVKQAFGVLLGIVMAAVAYRFDYRLLGNYAMALFVLDCILMVSPLLPGLGWESHGINGWIKVPIINQTFQPAELAKPVTIVLMAALGARYGGRIQKLSDYLKLCFILAVPFLLILLQPDLGTGLVILIAGAVVIVMSGPKRSWVIATIGILTAFVTVVLVTDSIIDAAVGDSSSLIKDYQMNRLLVFLDHNLDSSGAGYNLKQAMIAVGSGGLFGKGFGNATQAASGFLPEAHTDFVFALLSEEFGFVGAMLLLALFVMLIFSTIRLAFNIENLFGRLILVGIAALWTFQIFENIGMCLSLMPITGIPLPFISYGSSSMIVQLLTVGIVLSVGAHDGRTSIESS